MGLEYVSQDTLSQSNLQVLMQVPVIKPDQGSVPFGYDTASGADLLIAASQELDSPYQPWVQ